LGNEVAKQNRSELLGKSSRKHNLHSKFRITGKELDSNGIVIVANLKVTLITTKHISTPCKFSTISHKKKKSL
jgi:hypothetical protein